ncbi:MAG: hypothetical protein IT385_10600 [Deltaproteobacteria bacterium]|nr:hypothetical protein [Deltaproteobacteria bacterium]
MPVNPRTPLLLLTLAACASPPSGCSCDPDHLKVGRAATLALTIDGRAVSNGGTITIPTVYLAPGEADDLGVLNVKNSGNGDLEISAITVESDPPGVFELRPPGTEAPLSPGPHTVSPAGTNDGVPTLVAMIRVTRPGSPEAMVTGTLRIRSNSVTGETPTPELAYPIALDTKPPRLRYTPETASFGDVAQGAHEDVEVRVANDGGNPLVIRQARLAGHTGFTVAPDDSVAYWESTNQEDPPFITIDPPIAVAPGASRRLAIGYTASGPEQALASLVLVTNDPDAPNGSELRLQANLGVPIRPQVVIRAPDEAEGDVTCDPQTTAPETQGWHAVWKWQINGGDWYTAGPVLRAAEVAPCDLLHCQLVLADDEGHEVASDPAERQLDAGGACDDANACTDDACAPAGGGCEHAANTAPCGDDDPCNGTHRCEDRTCVPDAEPLVCDDDNVCTQDLCEPGVGCDHPPVVSAAPVACDDHDPCSRGDTCSGGACHGQAYSCPDDGLACTSVVCGGDAGCVVTVAPGYCAIGASCVEDKTVNPASNGCQRCDRALAESAWTDVLDGTGCVDGDACTVNDACYAGACEGSPMICPELDDLLCTTRACDDGACVVTVATSRCAIDGACWQDGDDNPDPKTCQRCDSVAPTRWSSLPNTASCNDGDGCTIDDACQGGACVGSARDCGDGLGCTSDGCAAGECTNTITSGCAIDGQCVAAGARKSADGCEVCDPAHPTVWSPATTALSCDDGDGCTLGDVCSGAVCQGAGCAADTHCEDDHCVDDYMAVAGCEWLIVDPRNADFKICGFTTPGSYDFRILSGHGAVMATVVGGGGGAGGDGASSGGGGAGGYIHQTFADLEAGTYDVMVGAGGKGFEAGGGSQFHTIEVDGGGFGSAVSQNYVGGPGGSGGGGGPAGWGVGGAGTDGQGHAGGNGYNVPQNTSGGGGGKEGGGDPGTGSASGNGGSGVLDPIMGVYMAEGGGGGRDFIYTLDGFALKSCGGHGTLIPHAGGDGADGRGCGAGGGGAAAEGGDGGVYLRFRYRTGCGVGCEDDQHCEIDRCVDDTPLVVDPTHGCEDVSPDPVDPDYVICTFTTPGPHTLELTAGHAPIEYTIVGGGGGAGNQTLSGPSGGGGGGGFRHGTLEAAAGTFQIEVGAGGTGMENGGGSRFGRVTVSGGGHGSSSFGNEYIVGHGGSGGGGGPCPAGGGHGGIGIWDEGHDGGRGNLDPNNVTGGGGGAGGAGTPASATASGKGGPAELDPITGLMMGGGGGGSHNEGGTAVGAAGDPCAGAGAKYPSPGGDGVDGQGCGAGGGGTASKGGDGGVYLRFRVE